MSGHSDHSHIANSTAMHDDEIAIGVSTVQALIATQFPKWADLPVTRVASSGTDNAMFRIGAELAARMPRIPRVVEQLDKERAWLPKLAPQLPLATPEPIAMGEAGDGYPWRWSVCRWIEGEDALTGEITDWPMAVDAVAEFIRALRQADPVGGPLPGKHNFHRGCPLELRDRYVQNALEQLRGMIDSDGAADAWARALAVAKWTGAPSWLHGDLAPGNLLVREGRICGVVDFGGLGVGDPACDLLPAWNFFEGEMRRRFRAALDIDDAMWERGRGWAISVALMALPYYLESNPVIVRWARKMIDAVLEE